MDTDRIRESLKNQMRRRFRSSHDSTGTTPPATSPTTATPPPASLSSSPSHDHTDNAAAAAAPNASALRDAILRDRHHQHHLDNDAASASSLSPAPVMRSPSARKLTKSDKDSAEQQHKKFKNNRITKSTSRPKLADLDKNHLHLHPPNNRKSSAPPDLDTEHIAKSAAAAGAAKTTTAAAARKHMRSHSNLNFNALLRYKLTNRVLATVDFGDSVRRKSDGIAGRNSSGGGGGSSSGESGFLAGLVRSGVAYRSRRQTAMTSSRESTPVADREPQRQLQRAADTNANKDNDHNECDGNDEEDSDVDTADDEDTADDDDDDDDADETTDVETSENGSDCATVVVMNRKKRDYIKEKEAAAEAARVYKKSPSLSARVAAHFTGTDVGCKHQLAKLKKQRRNSRVAGVYTQNSFGNFLFGLRSVGNCGWGFFSWASILCIYFEICPSISCD